MNGKDFEVRAEGKVDDMPGGIGDEGDEGKAN